MENNFNDFCQSFLDLREQQKNFVVVTLTHVVGSAPQNLGARMIVTSGSEILFGTVGGGKVEAHCLKVAQAMLESKQHRSSFKWNLQKDIGMSCGGEVSFLFESYIYSHHFHIAIFGAGHVSQALSRVLLNLDCKLTIIDQRQEWLAKLPKHKNLTALQSGDMQSELKKLEPNTYVISMTMGHATDVPILYEALINYNFPFIGVIGSVAKRNAMEKELLELGLDKSKLSEFHCPLGEKIGDNSPGEIAISITAQLLKVKDQL